MQRKANLTLHLGRKGSGKSWAAKKLAFAHKGRVWVWDPRAEWAGPVAADARGEYSIVRDLPSWLDAAKHSKLQPPKRIAFQCRHEDFELWCKLVSLTGNGLFIVDEAHLYASRSPSRALVELVRVCRHARADLLLVAQRPAGLCPDIRSQVDSMRCWQFTEPRDLAWIADIAGESFSLGLQRLRNHASVIWNPSKP